MTSNTQTLIQQIHEILDGKLDEQHAKSVAEAYIKTCERLDARIKQFTKLIREGYYYAALDVAQLAPSLNQTIQSIRFPREKEWNQFLVKIGLPTFSGFNDNELKRVKEICADSSLTQPNGYKDYRSAILQKDPERAVQALRQLHEDFPKDLNAKQELVRLETMVFENIDQNLKKLLQADDRNAILELVRQTKEQPWKIELHSEAWEKGTAVYRDYEIQNKKSFLESSITQLKVIQRVGNWKDGEDLAKELRNSVCEPAFERLDASDKRDWKTLDNWFQQQKSRAEAKQELQKQFAQFAAQLEPEPLQLSLKNLNRRQVKRYATDIQQNWESFATQLPSATTKLKPRYQEALQTLSKLGSIKKKSTNRRFIKSLFALPVIAIAAAFVIYARGQEAKLAAVLQEQYESSQLQAVKTSLNNWEKTTSRLLSNYNPFRNYSAHESVNEIQGWVNEIAAREGKVQELLGKIEISIEEGLNPSELRRVSLNINVVEELIISIPEVSAETDTRFQSLKSRVAEQRGNHIAGLRAGIEDGLTILDHMTEKFLDPKRINFERANDEISEVRAQINAVELIFRQSFEASSITDLKRRLEEKKAELSAYEVAIIELQNLERELPDSISSQEYKKKLQELASLPFSENNLVKLASALLQHEDKINNLARELLLPQNPLAWDQFQKSLDKPLYVEALNEKEMSVLRALSKPSVLKTIYRYNVFTYSMGQSVGGPSLIYSEGPVELINDQAQTRGNLLQKVQEFDPGKVGMGKPFSEKFYQCQVSVAGKPLEGSWLVEDRLSPESGFFKLLPELCLFDENTGTLGKPLLDVIDVIKSDSFMSPIFKAYLIQVCFNGMLYRPFDWGLNFSPTAQLEYKQLSAIKGNLYPYDWMRKSVQNRLLAPLADFFSNLSKTSYFDEARASRELFKQIASQRIRFGGFVDQEGEMHLLRSTPKDRKLFGLSTDGKMVMLRQSLVSDLEQKIPEPLLLTPLLFFNDPPQVILDRVTRTTGVEVNSPEFQAHLPEIFLP